MNNNFHLKISEIYDLIGEKVKQIIYESSLKYRDGFIVDINDDLITVEFYDGNHQKRFDLETAFITNLIPVGDNMIRASKGHFRDFSLF